MDFRPSETISPQVESLTGSASSGLSSGLESIDISSAIMTPSDLSSASISGLQTAISGGVEAQALSAPLAQIAPGSDAALSALVGAANEPISPLVQMIMKLPGAMGLVNSLFEFLSHFFMSSTSIFDIFNPSFLGQVAASFSTSLTQMPLNFSMMAAQSTGLGSLATTGLSNSFLGTDLLSAKLNISLGHTPLDSLSRDGLFTMRSDLGISGNLDFQPSGGVVNSGAGSFLKGAGSGTDSGFISGPGLGEGLGGNHIAGNTRLFSDRIGMGGANTANVPTNSASSISGTVNGSGANAVADTTNITNVPAVGSLSDGFGQSLSSANNAGFEMSSVTGSGVSTVPELGPSGALQSSFDGRELISMDPQSGSSFRPTIDTGADSRLSAMAEGGASGDIAGLKAKQLSLDAQSGSQGTTGTGSTATSSTATSSAATSSSSGATLDRSTPSATQAAAAKNGSAHSASKSHTLQARPSKVSLESTADSLGTEELAMGSNEAATSYAIKSGDNLWNIARDKLGDGSRWEEIYNLNQNVLGSNPDLIYPGQNIELPGQLGDIADQGAATVSEYVVQPGDNLWNISRDHLGNGADWKEIYSANQDIIGSNPNLIHPGQELRIPGLQSSPGSGLAGSPPEISSSQGDMSLGNSANSISSTNSNNFDFDNGFARQPNPMPADASAALSPQELFSRGHAQALNVESASIAEPASMASAFRPTLAPTPISQGLPVVSSQTPMPAGPGAAHAATATSQNAAVVSSGVLGDLKEFLSGKR